MSLMPALPANIDPNKGRLPATYEKAKQALATCDSLDECQDIADKAEALASYARQAQDTELRRQGLEGDAGPFPRQHLARLVDELARDRTRSR